MIELHAFGGLTRWLRPASLTTSRTVAVSAAGPAVGIATGTLALAVSVAISPAAGSPTALVLEHMVFVNLGWGLLNLAPILPLDGGNIVAALARRMAGRGGVIAMRLLSLAMLAGIAIWALLRSDLWLVILSGLLGWMNWQALMSERRRLQTPPSDE